MLHATLEEGALDVSEPLPNQEPSPESTQRSQNSRTIIFMAVLSFICALILSLLASALAEPKEIAKDLDRSKQMMIAAKILSHDGHFLVKNEEGQYVPAQFEKGGRLIAENSDHVASQNELLEVYKLRLIPMLIDKNNDLVTFQQAHINEEEYLDKNKKIGYYRHPYKLIYTIMPNPTADSGAAHDKTAPEGYVIPVNGFGLWDAIYGYLAISPDGNTVIGITWYDQKETPGLGANIADEPWQNLFPGKQLFQADASGKTDFKTAPLGIIVVKGKVAEVLGNAPKSKSAVDGMAGATLTGNGVTDAYKDVLKAYRPFLLKLSEQTKK